MTPAYVSVYAWSALAAAGFSFLRVVACLVSMGS